MDAEFNIENLWEALLGEEAPRIRKAWLALTDDEAQAVVDHLRRMTSEDGWAEIQRQAAATALRVIADMG